MPRIETGSAMVDGVSTFFRRVPGDGVPVVFVHGNPTHSEDWQPFLERMEGPALAFDLPGWGRSARPSPDRFDYSMDGLAGFVGRFLEQMDIGEYSLVTHDWGGVALINAQRDPKRVRRLLIANTVPLLPGYRWHRIARVWRRHGLGELSNRLWSRRVAEIGLRESRGDWSRHDPAFVDYVWDHLDAGTFRAILALYRSADPPKLAEAGARLGEITAPALVVWGMKDRYIPGRFGAAYAARLPDSTLIEAREAGHWPWLDSPDLVETMIRFVTNNEGFSGLPRRCNQRVN